MKRKKSLLLKAVAFLIMLSTFLPTLTINVKAQTMGTALNEDQKILHVLNRLGFGARPGDVEKVKAVGLKNYIEQQLNADSINNSVAESKVKNLDTLKLSNAELFAKYPVPAVLSQLIAQEKPDGNTGNRSGSMAPPTPETKEEQDMLQQQVRELYRKFNLGRSTTISQQLETSRILRAVYSERQLEEVMVDFWSNHFNVYARKQSVYWFLPEYDRDVIRPNALGKFKDLLLATAKSPAMLYYLDNFDSVSPIANQEGRRGSSMNPPRQQRGINENYAREIMELHTLGVEGGYTQNDIKEVARAFTGWTITDPRGYRSAANVTGLASKRISVQERQLGLPINTEGGKFYFKDAWHDSGEKIVLGQKINEGGIKDGLRVIDILAIHPSTAKFIARKLAVKFVSDNPSEDFVNRIAEAFTKSDGDIKATLRAMFNDAEFYAPENYRAKIKTPFEVLISGIRTIGADTDGVAVRQMLAKMGEPLYGWQFPTGYPDTAKHWVNTGALLERMNYAIALSSNRIPGTDVNLSRLSSKSDDKAILLNNFVRVVLNGEISDKSRASLLKQLEQPLPEPKLEKDDSAPMEIVSMQRPNRQGGGERGPNQPLQLLPPSGDADVFKVVGVILGSPEFQRQ